MRVYHWGFAAALLMACLSGAEAAGSCFSLSDWQGGWTPDGDETLYLKVRMHDVYRIDLAHKEGFLSAPGMHLVTKSIGGDTICNPVDLDISIADSYRAGFATRLFVKAITKLTPEEIAALPPKLQP